MNKVHRTIWSESKGAWVVASEHAAPRGKRSGSSVSARAGAMTLLLGTALAGIVPLAQAQTSWNAVSGNWLTAGNWTAGLPASGTQTFINNSGTATLGLSAAATGATGQLVVGHTSIGNLVVQNGSTLTSSNSALFGNVSGSVGNVTITGGSTWANTGAIEVGRNGSATLSISGSSVVTSTGNVLVASGASGSGTATVDGSGSKLSTGGVLVVGQGSSSTSSLAVSNGAAVSASSLIQIGNGAGSTGTMSISGGSSVTSSGNLLIASGSNATGTVTVDGSGSSLVDAGVLVVGQGSASTGRLTVTNSAAVTSSGAIQIGNGTSSTGTVNVSSGGTVTGSSDILLGTGSGATGTVTVDGSGSTVTAAGAFVVGQNSAGSLTVTNGGVVTVGGAFQLGNAVAGATGTALVDGAGSKITAAGVSVGGLGSGTLSITNGGAVESQGIGLIGAQDGSSGAVSVDGAGSDWTVDHTLIVGFQGASTGELTITNGGHVFGALSSNSSQGILLGYTADAVGTVTVDGSGSTLETEKGVLVGSVGTGTLSVTGGGTVIASNLEIGGGSWTVGYGFDHTATANAVGQVTVDGSGSALAISKGLAVGPSGTGSLTIQNGGTASSGSGVIAGSAYLDASGNPQAVTSGVGTVLVTGSGSSWKIADTLTVGGSGSGALTVAAGGTVSSANAVIGGGDLFYSDSSDNASTYVSPTGTGTVLVTGTGSSLTTSGTLTVGYTGTGTLTIANSGTVETLSLTRGTGTAQVNFDGGTLRAMGSNTGFISGFNAGELNIESGGATVDDASYTVASDSPFSGIGALTKVGSGTLILNADSPYTGGTTVSEGTLVVGDASHTGAALSGGGATTVAAGATLGGYGSVTGTVTNNGTIAVADAIAAAGTTTGNFSIIGTLINNSLARVGGSGVGNTLTVNSYVGNSGSSLALNTYLGTDGSPSDRLIVNGGTASGNSALAITNVGGAGALTYGNGIKVVDAINGATTASGAFTLSKALVAGPYEYTLYRGSTDGSDAQDWYLRSILPLSASGSATPNYRQEVSLYTALPSMAQLYGRTLLDTLHERVGAQEQLRGNEAIDPNRTLANGAWGRVIGQHGSQGKGSIYSDGPKFDYDIGAAQVGLDVYREAHEDGTRDHAGLYGASGHLGGDVMHADGTRAGHNSFDAHTLGLYGTHFGASGWYVDGVAQFTRYENMKALSSRVAGLSKPITLSTSGHGISASLEGGYPIRLDSGWVVEPQAQLTYQRIDLEDAADVAATVRFPRSESLAGRVGARFAKTWAAEEGSKRVVTGWLRANLWHEFMGDNKTEISSAAGFLPFRSDLGGTWLEVAGGFTGQLTRNTTVFAQAGYMQGTSGRHGYNAKLGVRVNW